MTSKKAKDQVLSRNSMAGHASLRSLPIMRRWHRALLRSPCLLEADLEKASPKHGRLPWSVRPAHDRLLLHGLNGEYMRQATHNRVASIKQGKLQQNGSGNLHRLKQR